MLSMVGDGGIQGDNFGMENGIAVPMTRRTWVEWDESWSWT
jgi:hypothetical protein